jgi:protein-L-isoaspartate O-methyltransferase
VLKVNRAAGRINSVLVAKVGVVPIEDVADYRPPTPDQIVAAKAVAKLPPMTNFPPEGPTTVQVRSAVAAHTNNMATVSITQAAWNKMYKDYKGSRVVAETETHGAYRCRTMINNGGLVRAFISDAKVVGPPPKSNEPKPVLPPLERVARERPAPTPVEPVADDKTGKMMAGWTQTLKAGVEVVVADQLFPTPLAVVEEMMLLACIERTHHVLEPSAGTGAIAFPIAATGATLTCVEENWQLSAQLTRKLNCAETNCSVLARDFVEVAPTLEKFDRILMNPPFSGGQDIQHILLARRLLKHDGLLVAICAGGPRQHDKLKPLVDACGGEWRELPSGTFPGTGVRSILLTLTAG